MDTGSLYLLIETAKQSPSDKIPFPLLLLFAQAPKGPIVFEGIVIIIIIVVVFHNERPSTLRTITIKVKIML